MFGSFNKNRDLAEADGVHIGGWSLRNVLTPKKKDGVHSMPKTLRHCHQTAVEF